jgi:hypothetical protein
MGTDFEFRSSNGTGAFQVSCGSGVEGGLKLSKFNIEVIEIRS